MSRASLYDFRDLDLMLKLAETAGADGLASSVELAEAMGLGDNGTLIASRCNWMARDGMLAFDKEHRGWRLSRGGERVVEAKLRAAAARAIDDVPEEQLVEVMAHVTTRYRLGDPMTAAMLRREFRYGTRPR
jgi:hypothetical protein